MRYAVEHFRKARKYFRGWQAQGSNSDERNYKIKFHKISDESAINIIKNIRIKYNKNSRMEIEHWFEWNTNMLHKHFQSRVDTSCTKTHVSTHLDLHPAKAIYV